MQKLGFIIILLFSLNGFAANMYDLKINGEPVFNIFAKKGVPAAALKRTFDYLNEHGGKAMTVTTKATRTEPAGTRQITVKSEWIAIIDFTLPSDVRRLYIMNSKTGDVTKHHVAHGKGSGVRFATKFSNIDKSKMSSLGLYVGGSLYNGGHGQSLNLHGIDKSNNQAINRYIVMHGAKYVSESFLNQTGRLGRSWGCPAVSVTLIKKMNQLFKDGGVIYAYHKDLAAKALTTGKVIEDKTINDDADVDLDGEEEVVRKNNGGKLTKPVAQAAKAQRRKP